MMDEWKEQLKELDSLKEIQSTSYGPGAPAPPVDGR